MIADDAGNAPRISMDHATVSLPPDSSRCLVMGLAAGYHSGDVRPFLASLRAGGFAGRCVLFVSETTRGIDQMEAWGAEVVPFERARDIAHLPYNAYRYFLYKDFLHREGPFERILVSDVRDVIFQGDPFAHPWTEAVNATFEDRRMTIGTCPYVTRWITGHLGDAAWETVRHKPISCSGTTVAGYRAMLDYLDRLTGLMLPYKAGRKMMAGYDQGVHNHLLHNGQLAGAVATDNTGPILTLAYKQDDPALDTEGRILNDVGVPACIVHQYDRKPALFKHVRGMYPA